ncbi:MAG: TolC family protein [Deltaproteobacteria bacterium]|nr:TolC family protein [Deltaproteobacteria bacterium]
MSTRLLLAMSLLLPCVSAAAPRVVSMADALDGVRQSNLTWKSLDEYLEQAEALKRVGIGMFLPKAQLEGQWVHQGDRHLPDLSGFSTMGALLGDLVQAVVAEHPNEATRFAPYMQASSADAGSTFDAFVPPANMLSATFTVVVPVLTPEAIPFLRGALSTRDAAVQRIGFGREQLLFGVAKAYYGLLSLQSMIEVGKSSLESARQHFRSNEVKANLQAATQLEVKRAELEVARAESQLAELRATLEKTKAGFRYLSGIEGDFVVVEPAVSLPAAGASVDEWRRVADAERKDLIAARIEIEVADREVGKVWAKYFPSVNLIAQGKADNAKEMRFDDDPYSWLVMGTLGWSVFDGGIREAQLSLAQSQRRQKELAALDLGAKIKSDVEAAAQALEDARAARRLAERQLEVAHRTQALAVASESAGVATNLEIIDTNTMVFASEAQGLAARFKESMAILDLLAAAGRPVPFSTPVGP